MSAAVADAADQRLQAGGRGVVLLFLFHQGQLQAVVFLTSLEQLFTHGGVVLHQHVVLLQQFGDQLFKLFEGGIEHGSLRKAFQRVRRIKKGARRGQQKRESSDKPYTVNSIAYETILVLFQLFPAASVENRPQGSLAHRW